MASQLFPIPGKLIIIITTSYGYRELYKYLLPKIEELASVPGNLKNSGTQSTSPVLKPMNGNSPVKTT